MPALLLYLLKVNIALMLFCFIYYAILRQLTFYNLNRIYLATSVIFSSLYPAINFTSVVQQHQHLAQPLQVVVIQISSPAVVPQYVERINYWNWLVILFWLGVTFMALRVAIQFVSLYKLYKRSAPGIISNYSVRLIKHKTDPFSFWQSIYINTEQHIPEELQSILAHERVHITQWHTLDILLAEIALLFYWFNPGMWFIKKAINENLEFITDRKVLLQGADAKTYQYSLLSTSLNTSPSAIVNHFNISTLKKRIIMMNAKKSPLFKLIRYSLIIPVVLLLLLSFGTTKAAFIKGGVTAARQLGNQLFTSKKSIDDAEVLPTAKAGIAQLSETLSLQKDTVPKKKADESKFDISSKLFINNEKTYYIVDGKPVSYEQLAKIDPNKITSIYVLNPMLAGKAFGQQAAQGAVVVITQNGEQTATVKRLLQQLNVTKGAETVYANDLSGIHPPEKALNSIVIKKMSDTAFHGIKGKISSFTVVTTGVKKDTVIETPLTDNIAAIERNKSLDGKTIIHLHSSSSLDDDPLFVVDGIPAKKDEINKLDPNQIESITILKDKSATSLYGEKATNGVVLIVTKTGHKGTEKKP